MHYINSVSQFAYPQYDNSLYCIVLYCIVLYCIVSIHLYAASCSAHQSEALPVRETQREESSIHSRRLGLGFGVGGKRS